MNANLMLPGFKRFPQQVHHKILAQIFQRLHRKNDVGKNMELIISRKNNKLFKLFCFCLDAAWHLARYLKHYCYAQIRKFIIYQLRKSVQQLAMVVQWSICLPSTPTMQVRINVKATALFDKEFIVNDRKSTKRGGSYFSVDDWSVPTFLSSCGPKFESAWSNMLFLCKTFFQN